MLRRGTLAARRSLSFLRPAAKPPHLRALVTSLGVMKHSTHSIGQFFELVSPSLHPRSGKVFYSGRAAFSTHSPLYVIGVNPGGHPDNYVEETVGAHSTRVMQTLPANWSAYRDESWEGFPPGTYGMAPPVLHMLAKLGLRPEAVPSSNLIFVRSRSEADLADHFQDLAETCWPFHERVLAELRPSVVLCLGKSAGDYVRRRLGAGRLVAEFREQNRRGWPSRVYAAPSGLKVVSVTHPSRVDWRNPAADPSALVASALA